MERFPNQYSPSPLWCVPSPKQVLETVGDDEELFATHVSAAVKEPSNNGKKTDLQSQPSSFGDSIKSGSISRIVDSLGHCARPRKLDGDFRLAVRQDNR